MSRDPELYLDDPEYYQDPYGPLDTTFEDPSDDQDPCWDSGYWDGDSDTDMQDEYWQNQYRREEREWRDLIIEGVFNDGVFNEDLEDD